jgi:hypothetical protein
MGAKLGPDIRGERCLRTGYWGEYFAGRMVKWQEGGENCITRRFVTSTLQQLRGLSLSANCADRATAACRRSYYQLLQTEGSTWSADGSLRLHSRFRPEPLLLLFAEHNCNDQVDHEMDRACSTNDKRNAYILLMGKPGGENPTGRPRRNNIKTYWGERIG